MVSHHEETVLALSKSPNHSEPPTGLALRYGEGPPENNSPAPQQKWQHGGVDESVMNCMLPEAPPKESDAGSQTQRSLLAG